MLVTNSPEYRINWGVNLDGTYSKQQIKGDYGGQKPLKSIGNMVFCRGEKVYDKSNIGLD